MRPNHFTVLIAIPNDELFAAARQIVGRQVVIGVVILLLAIGVGWWGTKLLTRSLHLLVKETKLIRSFDFSTDTKVPTILSRSRDPRSRRRHHEGHDPRSSWRFRHPRCRLNLT